MIDGDVCPLGGARPHKYIGDGLLRAYAHDQTWHIDVPDDGTICARDVAPAEKSYVPGTLPHIERPSPNLKKHKKGTKK